MCSTAIRKQLNDDTVAVHLTRSVLILLILSVTASIETHQTSSPPYHFNVLFIISWLRLCYYCLIFSYGRRDTWAEGGEWHNTHHSHMYYYLTQLHVNGMAIREKNYVIHVPGCDCWWCIRFSAIDIFMRISYILHYWHSLQTHSNTLFAIRYLWFMHVYM